MIVLHASFPIDPDSRDQALELVDDLVEQSQAEDGMIDYRATTEIQNPNVIRFFEQYQDEEAFESHTKTEHFQTFEAALPDLLDGEPDVVRFDVEDATELEL